LGVAYKKDIDDVRESPALDIIHILQEKGAAVSYHDPYVPEIRLEHGEEGATPERMRSVELAPALKDAHAVVIVTDHSAFQYAKIVEAAALIVDTRNATKGIVSDKILKI
jgi:UDP-N-acetyl-D-glucosamine dehydrogenase